MRGESDFLQRQHRQLAVAIQKFLLEDSRHLKASAIARLQIEHPECLNDLRTKQLNLVDLEAIEFQIMAVVAKSGIAKSNAS